MNLFTTLGQELQGRGHQISVLSVPDGATRIVKASLDPIVIGTRQFPAGKWARWRHALSLRAGFAAALYAIDWLALWTEVLINDLPRALTGSKFDGMIMDQTYYGAECSVDGTDLPLAVACNALPVHFQPDIPVHTESWPYRTDRFSIFRNVLVQRTLVFVGRRMVRQIRQKRRRTRLPSGRRWNIMDHLNEIPPSLVQVSQLPACLDYPRRHAPEHFHHTGPWHRTLPI